MKLREFLAPSRTQILKTAEGKEALFRAMLQPLRGEASPAAVDTALAALLERESEGTTGIGGGVAIPHAFLPQREFNLTEIFLAIVPEGVEFQALDAKPVHVVFLLISSEGKVREHLQILARIARLFSQKDLVERLRQAHSPDEVWQMVVQIDDQHL